MNMHDKIRLTLESLADETPETILDTLTDRKEVYFSPGWERSIAYNPICYYVNQRCVGAFAFFPSYGMMCYRADSGDFATIEIDRSLLKLVEQCYEDRRTLNKHPLAKEIAPAVSTLGAANEVLRGLIGIGRDAIIACNMNGRECFAHKESDEYIAMITVMVEDGIFGGEKSPCPQVVGRWVLWPDDLAPLFFFSAALRNWQLRSIIRLCGTPRYIKSHYLRRSHHATEIACNVYPYARKAIQRMHGALIGEAPVIPIWPDDAVPVAGHTDSVDGLSVVRCVNGDVLAVSQSSLRMSFLKATREKSLYARAEDMEVVYCRKMEE